MENSNAGNTNDQQDNEHPKPTEDAGAKIETVTPDTEKAGAPNDQKISGADTGHIPETDQKDAPEETEEKPKPDAEDEKGDDSQNQDTGQDQNDGEHSGIETVTP